MEEEPWYVCEVRRAGPSDDTEIYIWLVKKSGPGRNFDHWFKAAASQRKEMLATALTAITTGLRVDAFLPSTANYATIERLYITRE